MKSVEFLGIGDPVVDEFIKLKNASVHCAIDSEDCTISMRWKDKIPFESSTIIYGVGNSANATVSAARLGLKAGLMGIVGNDAYGHAIKEVFTKEGLDLDYLETRDGMSTNHHYVLWFGSERTILVKHEEYRYIFPKDLPPPKTLYLSSLAETVPHEYYEAIADFADANPEMLLAFQPGTFQMNLGTEKLSRIYKRSNIFFCNKEEAARILGRSDLDMRGRLETIFALGPKIVIITDDRQGAYAYDGEHAYHIPIYPDPRPPFERTGAGDAFSSTVTAALTLGKPLQEALLWGPVNAMAKVQDIGGQRALLSQESLLKHLKDAPGDYRIETL
jgi:ribokinase